MSDIPEGYYINRGGKQIELMDYRREIAPDPLKKKRKRGGGGKRSFLILRDGQACHYCSNDMVKRGGPNAISVEHVVPRSAGGNNEAYNLVLACLKCNSDRGSEYYKCFCPFCREARYRHEHLV